MTEHALLRSVNERAKTIILNRALYRPHPAVVGCASGDDCAAPEHFRTIGVRPPSWEIDGRVYCADCTQQWAIAAARLEEAI